MTATTELHIVQLEQGNQLIFGDVLMNRIVRTTYLPCCLMEGKGKLHP